MHNWDDFRYFHAVAIHGSFSAAAASLGVNHSTVSRRIQVLEERHGVRLFERTQHGYSLTEPGSTILELIEKMEAHSQKASRVLLGQDARLEGQLNLTMPHDLFSACMAKPVAAFCEQYPGIRLHLMLRHGLKNLANREADMAIRLSRNPPDYLIGKRISRLQHGIYQSSTLQTGESTPIICWGNEDDIPPWAMEHCHNPRIVLRVDDLSGMYHAVKAGLGQARMPCFYPDQLADQTVKRLDVEIPLSDWGVWLLSHADLRETARVKRCKEFLSEELTKMTPLFQGIQSQ